MIFYMFSSCAFLVHLEHIEKNMKIRVAGRCGYSWSRPHLTADPNYCERLSRITPALDKFQIYRRERRDRWWSMLSLLHCFSSSFSVLLSFDFFFTVTVLCSAALLFKFEKFLHKHQLSQER